MLETKRGVARHDTPFEQPLQDRDADRVAQRISRNIAEVIGVDRAATRNRECGSD